MSGERGDVDNQTVDDWKERLTGLCEGYEPKDIFNMDKSGLVFKDTYRKRLHVKGDECAGGKRSKQRITIALCASMTGEKLKPIVIGKARKPRCFSNIKSENLPVTYRNNKTSWMTSGIFEEWLLSLDKKMGREKRNILLFVDNAPTHPHLVLKNIKLKLFPPNTTCKLQPMDQGIIETLKKKYRKRQLRNITAQMEEQKGKNGTELAKMITILNAIHWINSSWNEIEASTIVKCFSKAGFQDRTCDDSSADGEDTTGEEDDNIPLSVLKLSMELFGCDYNELSEIDAKLATHCESQTDWSKPATELLKEGDDTNTRDSDSD